MPTRPVHLPQLHRRSQYSNFTKYEHYRNEIREDCQQRCIYCDVHEGEVGGEKCMTLDHFRPAGGKHSKYPELKHEPTNLVWSCHPCNNLKGDLWPAFGLPGQTTVNGRCGFIDPFKENRCDYFELQDDGAFKAVKDPAEYMIHYLELNRPYLKFIRHRRDLIYQALSVLESYIESEIANYNAVLAESDLNPLDKARWTEDRKCVEALLDVIDGLDEAIGWS